MNGLDMSILLKSKKNGFITLLKSDSRFFRIDFMKDSDVSYI